MCCYCLYNYYNVKNVFKLNAVFFYSVIHVFLLTFELLQCGTCDVINSGVTTMYNVHIQH